MKIMSEVFQEAGYLGTPLSNVCVQCSFLRSGAFGAETVKPELTEVIEGWRAAHGKGPELVCRFLPRFHCELNPIERVWAYVKLLIREDRLPFVKGETFHQRLHRALLSVPADVIASFHRYSFRLFWAYSFENSSYDAPCS
jgi:hypothetical protein